MVHVLHAADMGCHVQHEVGWHVDQAKAITRGGGGDCPVGPSRFISFYGPSYVLGQDSGLTTPSPVGPMVYIRIYCTWTLFVYVWGLRVISPALVGPNSLYMVLYVVTVVL